MNNVLFDPRVALLPFEHHQSCPNVKLNCLTIDFSNNLLILLENWKMFNSYHLYNILYNNFLPHVA